MSTTKSLDNVLTTMEAISPTLGGITTSIVYVNTALASMGQNIMNTVGQFQTTLSVAQKIEDTLGETTDFTTDLSNGFKQVNDEMKSVPKKLKGMKKDYKSFIDDAKASPFGKIFEVKGVSNFFDGIEKSLDTLSASAQRGSKIGTKKGYKAPKGNNEANNMEAKFADYSQKFSKAYAPVSKSVNKGLDVALGSGKVWMAAHSKVSGAINGSIQTAEGLKGAFASMGNMANKVGLGKEVAPIVNFATKHLDGFIGGAQTLMTNMNMVSQVVGSGMQVMEGMKDAFGMIDKVMLSSSKLMPVLGSGLGILKNAFMVAGGAVRGLTMALLGNPIVLAVAAIAAGAYLLYANWESVTGFISDTWSKLKTIFTSPIQSILNAWSILGNFFSGLMDSISGVFSGAWDGIVSSVSGVVDMLLAPFDGMFTWLKDKFEWLSNPLTKLGSLIGGYFSSDDEEQTEVKPVSVKPKNKPSLVQEAKSESQKRIEQSALAMNVENKAQTINKETVINVTVNNPTSNVDVIEAIKEHERSQQNRQYEDIA